MRSKINSSVSLGVEQFEQRCLLSTILPKPNVVAIAPLGSKSPPPPPVPTLDSRVSALETQVASIVSQNTALADQVSALATQISALTSQVTALTNQVSALTTQISELKDKFNHPNANTTVTTYHVVVPGFGVPVKLCDADPNRISATFELTDSPIHIGPNNQVSDSNGYYVTKSPFIDDFGSGEWWASGNTTTTSAPTTINVMIVTRNS